MAVLSVRATRSAAASSDFDRLSAGLNLRKSTGAPSVRRGSPFQGIREAEESPHQDAIRRFDGLVTGIRNRKSESILSSMGDGSAVSERGADLVRNRRFESNSLSGKNTRKTAIF
jgi:hypothetical protein